VKVAVKSNNKKVDDMNVALTVSDILKGFLKRNETL